MWKGYPVEGYYDACWLTGLWSTQAKVESIVLKAAWHWGSNSSVVNYYLGEPGRIPSYIHHSCTAGGGLLNGWCPYVSPCFVGELLKWGL